MAASVATYCVDSPNRESPRQDIRPLSINHRDEQSATVRSRIRALVSFWEDRTCDNALRDVREHAGQTQGVASRELWKPCRSTAAAVPGIDTPPTYGECLLDLPPDYTATDSLAYVQCMHDAKFQTNGLEPRTRTTTSNQLLPSLVDSKIDFTSEKGFREHSKKKAKKAAAAAQKAKWADSDDEGTKEDNPEGGEGGDGSNGGDAGGDGSGDPPGDDGNGNADDDDWGAFGSGKKSKKKKKKKNAWEEFEEEEKRKEEEEKKKAEEETANADAGAGAADADPVDGKLEKHCARGRT